jgi:hypothetical protein
MYFEIKKNVIPLKAYTLLSVGGRSLLIDLLQGAPSKRNSHGPINYKDTKTKCRHYWCNDDVYRLELSVSHVGIFDAAL